jgi:hypothetical protein
MGHGTERNYVTTAKLSCHSMVGIPPLNDGADHEDDSVDAGAGIGRVNAPEVLIYRFPLVRDVGHDELLARATNLKIALAAYQAAAKEYPDDLIVLKQGIRVVEKSKG